MINSSMQATPSAKRSPVKSAKKPQKNPSQICLEQICTHFSAPRRGEHQGWRETESAPDAPGKSRLGLVDYVGACECVANDQNQTNSNYNTAYLRAV